MIEDHMPHITIGWVIAQQLCSDGVITSEDRDRITEIIDLLLKNETIQCFRVAEGVVLAIVDGMDNDKGCGTRSIASVMQNEILRKIKERLPKDV